MKYRYSLVSTSFMLEKRWHIESEPARYLAYFGRNGTELKTDCFSNWVSKGNADRPLLGDSLLPVFSNYWQTTYSNYKSPEVLSGHFSIPWFRRTSCRVISLSYGSAESSFGLFLSNGSTESPHGLFSILWFHQRYCGSSLYAIVPPKVLSGHFSIKLYGSARSPVGSFLYPTVWFRQKSCRVISLSTELFCQKSGRVISLYYWMVPPEVLSGQFSVLLNGSVKSPIGLVSAK